MANRAVHWCCDDFEFHSRIRQNSKAAKGFCERRRLCVVDYMPSSQAAIVRFVERLP
jgi:hypothetical protein